MSDVSFFKKMGHFKTVGRFLCFIILLVISASIFGCDDKQSEQLSETRLLMDTYCTITIHGNVDTEMLDDAFKLCGELEALLSMTIEGSDVWRINNSGGLPVVVDLRTVEVISAGIAFGELTGGLFDITIGQLSRLWDFNGEPNIPSEAELERARKTVDYRQMIITGDTVQLINPDTWIDLGAIAKGYIGEKVAEFLVESGVSGALIDLGGDVITIGNRQNGSPWRIALRDPLGSRDDRLGVIEVSGVSVISSGTYERQFDIDGIRYHHIIDPDTGMPAKTPIVSATVIIENAMIGEGISTSVILNRVGGLEYLFYHFPGFIGAVVVLETGEYFIFGELDILEN